MSAPAAAVLLDVKGPVATLTLSKPAITPDMGKQLLTYINLPNRSPKFDSVRVIVLTGTGKYFCTGMDLTAAPKKAGGSAVGGVGEAAAKGGPTKAGAPTGGSTKPYGMFEDLWSSAKPVIAAVNGPCLGGGVGLLYCCDLRVMTSSSFIKFPEAALGIFPALISGYIVPQLGPYLTQQLMMTGEAYSAEQLLNKGQITKVVPSVAELPVAVAAIVSRLLSAPKTSHAGVKRIVKTVGYQGEYHDEAMSALLQEFGGMMRSEEARYGMKVFRTEKKHPNWDEYYKNKKQKSKL